MATEKTIIDLDTLEEVPAPTETENKQGEEETEEVEETEEEEEEEETEEKDKSEEDEEEEEEEIEEEETEEKEEKTEEEEEEEETNGKDINAVLKGELEKEYGIDSIEDLREILDTATEVVEDNKKLKARIEELEKAPKEPEFKSEAQRKIYDFIKDYDPEKIADGINAYATLVSMDVEKNDPKLLMEQKFIMEHPELSLERARKKFQRDYESKYVINKDDFDDDKEYEEKLADIQDDLEIEAKKARKFLKEKQTEFKASSSNKEESSEVSQEVLSAIEKTSKEFIDHLGEIDQLTFEPEEGDDFAKFNYKFSKKELAQIKTLVVDNHLKNPSAYGKDGKLKDGFDPEALFQSAALIVSGTRMIEEALKSAETRAHIIKAEKIAERKPSRKAKSGGELKELSVDEQFERLAARKASK